MWMKCGFTTTALWMNYPMNFESEPSRFTTWKNGGYPGTILIDTAMLEC